MSRFARPGKGAVIFEDTYRNTEDGPLVPRQSTTTRLTVSASGGPFGGSFTLTTRNLEKLIAANGPGPVALTPGMTLGPYETYSATFECAGIEASGSENDVEVEGAFVENITGLTENPRAVVTVVQVEFEPVVDLEYRNRHVIGVREECFIKWRPTNIEPTVSPSGEGLVTLNFGRAHYLASLESETSVVSIAWGGVNRDITLSTLAPSAIFVGGTPTLNSFGLGHNHAGGVGMILELYVMPTNVSFLGVAVQEVPSAYADPHGYFANPYFRNVWSHTKERHAGEWHNIATGNFFMSDNADMGDELPRMTPEGIVTNDDRYGWSDGTMNWKIPVGWNERNSSDEDVVVKSFQTYWQQFGINAQGTLRVQKLGNWVQRGTNTVTFINGVVQ